MANDLVIVSFHEKGFWQADYYREASDLTGDEMDQIGLAPDGFCTFSKDVTLEDAMRRARDYWPGSEVVWARDDEDEEEEATP